MRAALALAVIAAAASPARADDTFETKAQGAQRVHRIENVVWALTAPCDQGDDTEQRQCRIVRERRAAELAAATLLVDAEAESFEIGPWNAAKKTVSLLVTGCVRCSGVQLDGKTWYVVAGALPPKPAGAKVRPGSIGDATRAFPDEATAHAYAAKLANARVQMLVKLAGKPRWTESGQQGIALDVLGWRVISPCDGAIVAASPPSGSVEADKKACTQIQSAKPADDSPKLDELTPTIIKDSLHAVIASANQCFNKFGVAGNAKLKFTVTGDGAIAKYEQLGDFAGTPTGECIDKSIERATFPRTKKRETSFVFPIQLR